jgi:SagB-type dehydrogenase family enzyme
MQQTVVKLPPPQLKGKVSLEEAIAKRRSVRRYRTEPLTLFQLSQILWSAQGITGARKLRAAPSAGATYPLEIFAFIGKQGVITSQSFERSEKAAKQPQEELQAGIYHYEVASHSLKLHQPGDLRVDLARAALDQGFIAQAPVNIVICALYPRTSYTYGRRGERYVHMEVGHVGENIHLQAIALGLATAEVGAFDDEQVRKVLGLEEQIKPLHIMPLGKPL